MKYTKHTFIPRPKDIILKDPGDLRVSNEEGYHIYYPPGNMTGYYFIENDDEIGLYDVWAEGDWDDSDPSPISGAEGSDIELIFHFFTTNETPPAWL